MLPDSDPAALPQGRLLDMLVGNMDQAASSATSASSSSSSGGAQQQPRMYMYSGHDSTLMPLLQALGHDVVTW
jgi:lysophosphatidic acid phosphatase type 6